MDIDTVLPKPIVPKKPWKAPRWLAPLVLMIVCCVGGGGSMDVAIRTGLWGVCTGALLASIVLLVAGMILFSQAREGNAS